MQLSTGLVEVHSTQTAASVALHGNRISGLDGLRAVSVAIVFISHYAPVVFPQYPVLVKIFPGMFGVAIFFVISGLLISTLLLEEYKKTTDISLQKFYIRRLLRLSPALLIYVLIFFIAYSLTDKKVDTWAFVAAATYTSNYYQSVVGG
jgi:peptidoglycan/LPS O-acetylase OafA/YrhL